MWEISIMKKTFDVREYLRDLLQNGNERERAFAAAMLKRYVFEDALAAAEVFLPNDRAAEANLNGVQKSQTCLNWRQRVDVLKNYRDQIAARQVRLVTLGLNRHGRSYEAIAMKMSEAVYAWSEWLDARIPLAEFNIGLVHKAAGRYWYLAQQFRCEYADMFAAGYAGLMIAFDNFDVARGVALSTYAIPWITREIQDELRKHALIRIPREQVDNLVDMFEAINEFFTKNGRYPTPEELDERFTHRDAYQIAALKASNVASLDEPKGNPEGDGSFSLVDTVSAAAKCQPEEVCMLEEIRERINNAIGKLGGRDQFSFAIKNRIPLDAPFLNLDAFFEEQEQRRPGFHDHADEISRMPGNITYDDLGELLGVSRQRSEQIVKIAMQKLRDQLGGLGDD